MKSGGGWYYEGFCHNGRACDGTTLVQLTAHRQETIRLTVVQFSVDIHAREDDFPIVLSFEIQEGGEFRNFTIDDRLTYIMKQQIAPPESVRVTQEYIFSYKSISSSPLFYAFEHKKEPMVYSGRSLGVKVKYCADVVCRGEIHYACDPKRK